MAEIEEIPLFPLRTVLFPRGKLALQIFEKRYLDLVSSSLKNQTGFGITLLKEGQAEVEPGVLQQLHTVGTLAYIVDWDQLDNGLLGITVEGDCKFAIQDYWRTDSGLYMARVSFSEQDMPRSRKIPVGEDLSGLTELLHVLEEHPVIQQLELDIDYQNLRDLGWRLSELIPAALEIKQELLELDDPFERIRLVERSIQHLIGD